MKTFLPQILNWLLPETKLYLKYNKTYFTDIDEQASLKFVTVLFLDFCCLSVIASLIARALLRFHKNIRIFIEAVSECCVAEESEIAQNFLSRDRIRNETWVSKTR